ncbi:hypothetical protein JCM14036_03550 [Desulfotomaculum defluvii]
MGQVINILHLSDIHFGIEPKPEDNITLTTLAQRENILIPLIKFISNIEVEWKPEIIAITGDIGWKGLDSDYNQAVVWLEKLINALNLTKSDLILCAGNHDLDRKSAKNLIVPDNAAHADEILALENLSDFIRPFEAYNKFCDNLGVNSFYIGTEKQSQHLYGVCEIKGIRFIVLNSAWFCRGNSDKGKLWLGLPQLEVIRNKGHLVDEKQFHSDPITISLFHHPKEWFNSEEYYYHTNRKCGYNYIVERCHIILNGHVHSAIVEPTKDVNGAWVFTGGTTYSGSEYKNSFQIIQINTNTRSALRRAYEYDPRFEKWNMTLGKSPYPLATELGVKSVKDINFIESKGEEAELTLQNKNTTIIYGPIYGPIHTGSGDIHNK